MQWVHVHLLSTWDIWFWKKYRGAGGCDVELLIWALFLRACTGQFRARTRSPSLYPLPITLYQQDLVLLEHILCFYSMRWQF